MTAAPANMIDFDAARCKHCGDAGWVLVEYVKDGQIASTKLEQCRQCGVVDGQRAAAASKLSPLIENLDGKTFETYNVCGRGKMPVKCLQTAKRAAEAFATLPTGWLIFYGKNGNGKTHLLAAIKNQLEQADKPVTYISAPMLMDMCRGSNDPDWQGERPDEILRMYSETPVLLLDDLYQGERSTPFSVETWFKLLNHRAINRLPTAISTNINIYDPKAFDNAAVYDRFQARDLVFAVLMDAQSYR